MKLILFDIDGTLIRSNGAGRAALRATLETLFGTAGPLDDYKMSGKTDARIVTDLLAAVGVAPDEARRRLPEVYALMAEQARALYPRHKISACVGVPQLLAALAQAAQGERVGLGLLTGNAAQTAPLKLIAGGIDTNLFAVGAYGSDHADRNQLPLLAMERAAARWQRPFTGADTVVIGDTPADILCARAGQATAVAVATGWHAADTLARYTPDHLLMNLADTEQVLQILLSE